QGGVGGVPRLRRLAVAAVLAATTSLAAPSLAGATPDPWARAQARLHYQLVRPTATLGLRASGFGIETGVGCHTEPWIWARYGSMARHRYVELGEGSPRQCSDPGESTDAGTRTIGRLTAWLVVLCPPGRCTVAQGRRWGYGLTWSRPPRPGSRFHEPTGVHVESFGLGLSELLLVARSLAPVAG